MKLANKHMMSSQDIFWWQEGQRVSGSVISPNAENKPEGIKEITNTESLTVDLVPKGAFAALAREEKIMQLVQNGILTNPEVIAEGLNLGSIRELYTREMQFRKENAPVQQEGKPQGAGTPQGEQLMDQTDLRDVVESLKQEI